MLRFSCPGCGTNYELPDDFTGRKVCCEVCNTKFYTPQSNESVDIDKTIPPQRAADGGMDDVTMPGKRDRKPDGRFTVGDLIMNRYKVLAELGQGGMGVVYKCFDETAGIEVALKALPPELSHNTLEMEDIKDNFQLVHNLHHPNIASSNTLEKDNSNGNYYLIMECCEGEDLRRWIRRKRREGGLTLEDVLPVIKQVADALDYAHEMKIIHRDIKPGNIMIDSVGKIKVLDFGLAAQIHTSMTRVSMAYHGTSGTGPYMAPEQWEGRIQDAKADQYALAVMTYEMLAGHLPFESTDPAVLREAVLKSKVIPLENISSSANAAVMRALSKDPAERFKKCSDFAEAFGGKKIKTVKKGYSGKWIAAIIVFVLLCAGGTGYYLLDKQQKEKARIAEEKYIAEEKRIVADKAGTFRNTFTVKLPNDVKLEMVKIKAGTFIMGSPYHELGRRERRNQHRVALTQDYWLSKFEVTQAQWEAVMGNNPSKYKGSNRPVEVTFVNAKKFCDKLNKLYFGKLPIGYQFNLPTEAQWECACRAGTTTALNNGKDLTDEEVCSNLDKVAWYAGNSAIMSVSGASVDHYEYQDVGKKEPNAWGLYDMHGNLAEWCRDNYEQNSWSCWRDATDPVGSSRYPQFRGGSYDSEAKFCRSAYGTDGTFLHRGGIRLALVPIDNKKQKLPISPVPVAPAPEVAPIVTPEPTPTPRPASFTKIDCNGVELEMVKVQAGTFTMGRNHRVTLTKDYWLGKFEVTQAQWEAVMRNNPSKWKGEKLPVENVSWNDVMAFCEKLNRIGKAPNGWKFTLPTETQWEYAARGGSQSCGYIYSGSNDLNSVGWYRDNAGRRTHPVGRKLANELGLYDMSGNVWEWCLDDYKQDIRQTLPEFARGNDRGGSKRVYRGGNWHAGASLCDPPSRLPAVPNERNERQGFRLALVPIDNKK